MGQTLHIQRKQKQILKENQIKTLRELIARKEEEIASLRNLGKRSVDEIKDKLSEHSLSLGMSLNESVKAGKA